MKIRSTNGSLRNQEVSTASLSNCDSQFPGYCLSPSKTKIGHVGSIPLIAKNCSPLPLRIFSIAYLFITNIDHGRYTSILFEPQSHRADCNIVVAITNIDSEEVDSTIHTARSKVCIWETGCNGRNSDEICLKNWEIDCVMIDRARTWIKRSLIIRDMVSVAVQLDQSRHPTHALWALNVTRRRRFSPNLSVVKFERIPIKGQWLRILEQQGIELNRTDFHRVTMPALLPSAISDVDVCRLGRLRFGDQAMAGRQAIWSKMRSCAVNSWIA